MIMTDEEFRALLVTFERRLKQLHVPPGVVPPFIMRDVVLGKMILIVIRMPDGPWQCVRGLPKPHPLERLFETTKQ